MLRLVLWALFAAATMAIAQTTPSTGASQPKITLEDALKRARQFGGQVQSASFAVALAQEDRRQAKALALPTVNAFNQFIYTEGNGTPSGVFVANDGVHIYNEQAVVHEELLSVFRHGEVRRALANEAAAKARVELAARGLNATVIQNYYAIATSTRRLTNTALSLREAQQFLDITQKQEAGGEAAHADVIKAQIQVQQRERDVNDAQLATDKAKIALGVLIFPNFTTDFAVVDDLSQADLLPPLEESKARAISSSPDLKVARFGVEAAGFDIGIAHYAYLPSFALDFFYGINANQFAARTPERQNLGYAAQATLNIPVWNWGVTRSKINQAELRKSQAQADLTLAQRTLESTLATSHAEARGAQAQIASLRSSADLAAESLRLTLLRYQAGEAAALEVVDAQTTVTQARNAYDDGLARYRIALATLQTLTGSF